MILFNIKSPKSCPLFRASCLLEHRSVGCSHMTSYFPLEKPSVIKTYSSRSWRALSSISLGFWKMKLGLCFLTHHKGTGDFTYHALHRLIPYMCNVLREYPTFGIHQKMNHVWTLNIGIKKKSWLYLRVKNSPEFLLCVLDKPGSFHYCNTSLTLLWSLKATANISEIPNLLFHSS